MNVMTVIIDPTNCLGGFKILISGLEHTWRLKFRTLIHQSNVTISIFKKCHVSLENTNDSF